MNNLSDRCSSFVCHGIALSCFPGLLPNPSPIQKPVNHQEIYYSLTGSSAWGKPSVALTKSHQHPVQHWWLSNFPSTGASLLLPSTGRGTWKTPLGVENLVPTHLWRQHGHSSSLRMNSNVAGLGEHVWVPEGFWENMGPRGCLWHTARSLTQLPSEDKLLIDTSP